MKILTKILFSLLCALPLLVAAQDTPSATVEKVLPKISLVSPAVGCEFGLSKSLTAFVEAGIAVSFSAVASNNVTGTYTVVAPLAFAELRNFYSLQKRQAKGKTWQGNSGAFFGMHLKYLFDAIAERVTGNVIVENPYHPSFAVGPVWGFQITSIKNSNFNFSISLGFGLAFSQEESVEPVGLGHVNVGFVFGNYGERK